MVIIERSKCGSGGCETCPFSCGPYAEEAYNYACLPTEREIVRMKEESGDNWGCHMDESKMCGGFAKHIKEERPDLNLKEGKLISYENWYRGEE